MCTLSNNVTITRTLCNRKLEEFAEENNLFKNMDNLQKEDTLDYYLIEIEHIYYVFSNFIIIFITSELNLKQSQAIKIKIEYFKIMLH